jgi:hypothetical protein
LNPGDMSTSEKTAWGLTMLGYGWAVLRYIFGAGTFSQRISGIEGSVKELIKSNNQLVKEVAGIQGELKRINGRH